MKHRIAYMGALALLLGACSNESPTAPPPVAPPLNLSCIGNNVCNSAPPTAASPDPSASGGCTIATVGNSLHGTSEQGGIKAANLAVGEQRTLDTTAKQANGQPLGANCQVAAVSWSLSASPAGACTLNSSSTYTPVLTARAVGANGTGTCEARATVGSVTATEPIVITVRAAGTLWNPPTLNDLLAPPLPIPRWEHTGA